MSVFFSWISFLRALEYPIFAIFIAGVALTGEKLIAGVALTGEKLITGVIELMKIQDKV
jgi:hypothetical protein